MKACQSQPDKRSKAKAPPCNRTLAGNLQQAVIEQLGTDATYFIVWRPTNDDLSPNGYVSNQRDRQRLVDWLRHMADGLERSA